MIVREDDESREQRSSLHANTRAQIFEENEEISQSIAYLVRLKENGEISEKIIGQVFLEMHRVLELLADIEDDWEQSNSLRQRVKNAFQGIGRTIMRAPLRLGHDVRDSLVNLIDNFKNDTDSEEISLLMERLLHWWQLEVMRPRYADEEKAPKQETGDKYLNGQGGEFQLHFENKRDMSANEAYAGHLYFMVLQLHSMVFSRREDFNTDSELRSMYSQKQQGQSNQAIPLKDRYAIDVRSYRGDSVKRKKLYIDMEDLKKISDGEQHIKQIVQNLVEQYFESKSWYDFGLEIREKVYDSKYAKKGRSGELKTQEIDFSSIQDPSNALRADIIFNFEDDEVIGDPNALQSRHCRPQGVNSPIVFTASKKGLAVVGAHAWQDGIPLHNEVKANLQKAQDISIPSDLSDRSLLVGKDLSINAIKFERLPSMDPDFEEEIDSFTLNVEAIFQLTRENFTRIKKAWSDKKDTVGPEIPSYLIFNLAVAMTLRAQGAHYLGAEPSSGSVIPHIAIMPPSLQEKLKNFSSLRHSADKSELRDMRVKFLTALVRMTIERRSFPGAVRAMAVLAGRIRRPSSFLAKGLAGGDMALLDNIPLLSGLAPARKESITNGTEDIICTKFTTALSQTHPIGVGYVARKNFNQVEYDVTVRRRQGEQTTDTFKDDLSKNLMQLTEFLTYVADQIEDENSEINDDIEQVDAQTRPPRAPK